MGTFTGRGQGSSGFHLFPICLLTTDEIEEPGYGQQLADTQIQDTAADNEKACFIMT